jgi:4-amino-4-deoxy-L-arabinose transferase-like glycosyltransferase
MTLTADIRAPAPDAPARPGRAVRWTLPVLLVGTAVLYLWSLSVSGWANAFYSAAAQAGSHSWKAFLFGSSDAANSITVDKPPLSLWPAALSVRVFGLNSWSVLVPQALMGVASVALLWATVRRGFGDTAGVAAGTVLALTPVAVSIFRYNNPDALLVLLMIGAVWAMLRAVDGGRTRWLLLSGVFVGLGYLTKQLQIMLIAPALGLTYLFAGPPSMRKRLGQSIIAIGAAVVAAGWWVLLVGLWPADERPWIGGTTHNSVMELTFGYNGFGRLTGNEPGSTAGLGAHRPGAAAHPVWGVPGIGRMFQPAQAAEIGWLLPTALLFLVVLLVWRWRAPRTDARRAQVLVWGGWLLCTWLVFSFMAGIFHPYYTAALAPAVAALVGTGAVVCWQQRRSRWARTALAAAVIAAAVTAYGVLTRYPHYHHWLPWLVIGAAAVVVVWLCAAATPWAGMPVTRVVAVVSIAVVALAGPAAFALTTVGRGNSGALPTAGPPWQALGGRHASNAKPAASARITTARGPGFLLPPGVPGRAVHVAGCSLLDAGTPPREVIARLDEDAGAYRWVAATVGSMCAAGYQLGSGHPVMPVGGFNATDPAPSADQFRRLVAERRIHYFIASNPVPQDGAGHVDDATVIQQWVQRTFRPLRVGRVLLYDLTG